MSFLKQYQLHIRTNMLSVLRVNSTFVSICYRYHVLIPHSYQPVIDTLIKSPFVSIYYRYHVLIPHSYQYVIGITMIRVVIIRTVLIDSLQLNDYSLIKVCIYFMLHLISTFRKTNVQILLTSENVTF